MLGAGWFVCFLPMLVFVLGVHLRLFKPFLKGTDCGCASRFLCKCCMLV